MNTLLLRLAAPLQSWGTDLKYNTRTTNNVPSKSGIIGLLAAALGCSRDDEGTLARLSSLRFGVRIDQEGQQMVDFHTVTGHFKNSSSEPSIVVTYRHYLTDAVFLVGLESPNLCLLEELEDALNHPVFPLFLGRRSCPPTLPLNLEIRDKDLSKALKEEPWLLSEAQQQRWKKRNPNENPHLRIVYEPDAGEPAAAFIRDLPLTFNPSHRRYGYRGYTAMDDLEIRLPEHDPMAEL